MKEYSMNSTTYLDAGRIGGRTDVPPPAEPRDGGGSCLVLAAQLLYLGDCVGV